MSAQLIKTPHLPQGKVGLAALGAKYREILEEPLQNLGITQLWLPDNEAVDPRLSGHADLMLLHLGGNLVVTSCGGEIPQVLSALGFEIIRAAEQGREYPADARLCACVVGVRCIHNFKISDPAISGFERVDVRQGYAKCCTCVVDEGSIITSDAGIAKAAARHGMDVLGIRPGFIKLEGFDTGFIGGAAFRISERALAFTGQLDSHPDKAKIEAYLRSHGIEPVYLTEQPVFDIGSAVLLTEAEAISSP